VEAEFITKQEQAGRNIVRVHVNNELRMVIALEEDSITKSEAGVVLDIIRGLNLKIAMVFCFLTIDHWRLRCCCIESC
jgi:DNA polymerase III psi subunit